MPKEIATLKANDNAFNDKMAERKAPKVRKIKHMIFTSNDEGDKITIPLCGATNNPIAYRRVNGLTCPDCLTHLLALANFDTYQEGLDYITANAPTALRDPDPVVMEETFAGAATVAALAEVEIQKELEAFQLVNAADAPLNQIGTSKEVYFTNLIEHRLVDADGEPNTPRLDRIQADLDALSP